MAPMVDGVRDVRKGRPRGRSDAEQAPLRGVHVSTPRVDTILSLLAVNAPVPIQAVEMRTVNPLYVALADWALPNSTQRRRQFLLRRQVSEVFRELDFLPRLRKENSELFVCCHKNAEGAVQRTIYVAGRLGQAKRRPNTIDGPP